MRLWIGSHCNCFRQSELLRMGLRRTGLPSLFCMHCKEWIKEADVEKGIAVIQARENETASRAEVVLTERRERICRIAQMR